MSQLNREQKKIIKAIRDYPNQAKQIHLVAEHADFEDGEVNAALVDLANDPAKTERKYAINLMGGLAALLPASAAIGGVLAMGSLNSPAGYVVIAGTTSLAATTAYNAYRWFQYDSRKYNYISRLDDARDSLTLKLRRAGQRDPSTSEDFRVLEKRNFYEEQQYL